jgi:hypothetical protein
MRVTFAAGNEHGQADDHDDKDNRAKDQPSHSGRNLLEMVYVVVQLHVGIDALSGESAGSGWSMFGDWWLVHRV